MATQEERILALLEDPEGIGPVILAIKGFLGDLALLDTTDKTSLVNAINETFASGGGSEIDDLATATTSTWSSTKIDTEISDSATATKAELLGGAGAAYDTFQELKGLLDAEGSDTDAFIAATNTALGNRLRIDAAQGLTTGQKLQGRQNLDALGTPELGDPDTDYLAAFIAASTPAP